MRIVPLSAEQTGHPTVLYEEPGFVVGAMRDVMFVLWATRATTQTAQKLEQVGRSLIAAHGKISSIHVAMNAVPLPEAPAREALQGVTLRLGADTIAVAVVLIGHGFWASALRAFVTSLRWGGASLVPFKVHVCDSTLDAAVWLAPQHSAHSSLPASAEELEAGLSELLRHPQLSATAR